MKKDRINVVLVVDDKYCIPMKKYNAIKTIYGDKFNIIELKEELKNDTRIHLVAKIVCSYDKIILCCNKKIGEMMKDNSMKLNKVKNNYENKIPDIEVIDIDKLLEENNIEI